MPLTSATGTRITKQFPSKSSSATYTATIDTATGVAWCQCNGWKFNKSAVKECTHTRQFLAEYARDGAPAPVQQQARADRAATAAARTPDPALPTDPVKPMLAQALTKGQKLASYYNDRYVLEVKKDGFRLVVYKRGSLLTPYTRPRSGKEMTARPELLTATMRKAFAQLPDGIYDGETMIPVTTSSRCTYPHFVLFDVIELLGETVTNRPYTERRQLLELAAGHYLKGLDPDDAEPALTLVEVMDPTDANVAILLADDQKQEGGILKLKSSRYEPGRRSDAWLKVKRSGAETVTITGFRRGDAESSTEFSVTTFRRDNGMESSCSTLNNDIMRDAAKNPAKYIGRRLVVSYTEINPSGALRHGGWKTLVDAEFDHLAGEGE
ncbi:MAG TPA: hypothetical protein VFP27_17910 [Mycobacterium sp.]|nr:hypothetical protein [Mycobacterium sp.]